MAEQMWRVVAVFRVVTLAYAAFLVIRDDAGFAHPAAGFLTLAVMAGWTVVTVIAYAQPAGRSPWLIGADVAVAAGLVLSTRLILAAGQVNTGAPTIPAAWAASSVLACAVAGGPAGGLSGAAVIVAADLAERQALPQSTFNNAVLVLIAGGVGGYVVQLGLRAEAAVDSAARREAAITERERIARGVHDSVLQVLALVSARGRELGGEAAELARLAGEQESALRTLVSAPPLPGPEGGQLDLAGLLGALARASVTVSCPAGAVPLAEAPALALAAATGEALDNVRRHAGPDARAWVLVEDDGGAVTVSVRDNGLGFAPGRLEEAEAAGRLGVAQSIKGRLRDVGGEARLTSSPGRGTEVELRVPRT
jgi:signal transduction histidine kinase